MSASLIVILKGQATEVFTTTHTLHCRGGDPRVIPIRPGAGSCFGRAALRAKQLRPGAPGRLGPATPHHPLKAGASHGKVRRATFAFDFPEFKSAGRS